MTTLVSTPLNNNSSYGISNSSAITTKLPTLDSNGKLESKFIPDADTSTIFSLSELLIKCSNCNSFNSIFIINSGNCLTCNSIALNSEDIRILNLLNVYVKTKRNLIPNHLKSEFSPIYDRIKFNDWLEQIEYAVLKEV